MYETSKWNFHYERIIVPHENIHNLTLACDRFNFMFNKWKIERQSHQNNGKTNENWILFDFHYFYSNSNVKYKRRMLHAYIKKFSSKKKNLYRFRMITQPNIKVRVSIERIFPFTSFDIQTFIILLILHINR